MFRIWFVFVCFSLSLFSQDNSKLGEKEIRSSQRVRFINRSSVRAGEEVRGTNEKVGSSLADVLKKEPGKTHSQGGISITRIAPEEKKFGADIFAISEDSDYGHINSIQRILTGFVKSNFGYDDKNSDILATYILYYNAIHRKDKSYIGKKYSNSVIKFVNPNSIGISRRYSEWPGKTQILIPLVEDILGKDVHTDELEDEVNKELDKKKEGQSEKDKFDDLQSEKNKKELEEVKRRKEENQNKQKEISDKETRTDKELQELNKDPVKNKTQIAEKKKEKEQIQKEKESAKKEEQKLKEKEKEVVKKDEERKNNKTSSSSSSSSSKSDSKSDSGSKSGTDNRSSSDNKKSEAELKKELAETKKELEIKKEEEKKKEEFDKNVVGGKILFLKTLKYLDKGHYNNELQVLDPTKDDTIFRGEFNKICGRTFEIVDGKALVIGFEDGHSSNHKLILIDQETLKPVLSAEDNIFWRSPMIVKGDEIYAFEEVQEKYYLSRFSKDLKKQAKSSEEISPNSNVTFYGEKIYVTGKEESSGSIQITVFNKADLKLIKKIKP
ncbi:P83/100 family protein [Leptospira santarosai]|uniref:P83/100 family protein n=1 Tax=Leptospira santarosai TaxID=28183 RepID=UPI0024AF2157|nr:P83/100 family protein [Leptospira santarosai]MDI7205849.1 P83/100 family protein [Leptospira santarosai]MDI7206062.1 P83/100 family protein [Leptospira santarosai]